MSLSSFVAREGLRAAEVLDNREYPMGIMHNGAELFFNATTTLAKTEIMKQNPETGELMVKMKTCIVQEEFEEAAKLKKR